MDITENRNQGLDAGSDAGPAEQASAEAETPPDRRLLAVIFLLTLGGYLCQPNYDPEFFQHLTVGRQIHAAGAIPAAYLWSPFAANASWAPPSVFFDEAAGSIFQQYGFAGLLSVKLAIYVGAVFLLCWVFSRASGDRFFAGVIATVAASGILVRGDFTPNHPGLAGLLLVLLLLLEAAERRKLAAAAIAMLILLLSGLCPAAAAAALLAVIVATIFPGIFPAARAAAILAAVFVSAGAIFTPLGLSLAAEARDRAAQILHLAEFYNQAILFDYAGAALLLIVVLGLILGGGPQGLKRRLFLLILLPPAALPGFHFILPYLVAAAGFLVCLIWRFHPAARHSPMGVGISLLKTKLTKTPEPGSSFLLVCLTIVNTFSLYQTPAAFVGMPVQEAERILKMNYAGPVLTEAPAAGYLNYKFSAPPQAPRLTVFAAEADLGFDPSRALAAVNAIRGKDGWDKLLADAAPGVILIRSSRPLAKLLAADARKLGSVWRLDSTGGRPLEDANLPSNPEQLPGDQQPVIDWSLFIRR